MPLTLRPHQAEALETMTSASRGQVIVPTGGGKTLIAIMDGVRQLNTGARSLVVVAPRILLAQQLCEEWMEVIKQEVVGTVVPAHIHSGETNHFSTTKAVEIQCFDGMMQTNNLQAIYFTTYHSLHRLAEAGIEVDTIYFDEAHNSTRNDFFPATQYFSETAIRSFFFTATPKHSVTKRKHGMNDVSVYGNVIVNVPAPKLVQGGFIVPPQIHVNETELFDTDCEHIIQSLVNYKVNKALVCAKSVKQIIRLYSESNFAELLEDMGYSHMYISAKTGAVIDGVKVSREEFFKTLNKWGKDNEKKFVVLHHSILSEGINVSGLEGVIFLRNMDYIAISQTIGRVIRLHKDDAKGLRDGSITPGDLSSYTKSFGLCIVPVYSASQKSVARSLQNVANTIFVEGEAATSVVRR